MREHTLDHMTSCFALAPMLMSAAPSRQSKLQRSSAAGAKVCRVCHQLYLPEENGPRACRSHPAAFTGRLMRAAPTETSDLQYFYDCCGATDRDAPGCFFAAHKSYDDE